QKTRPRGQVPGRHPLTGQQRHALPGGRGSGRARQTDGLQSNAAVRSVSVDARDRDRLPHRARAWRARGQTHRSWWRRCRHSACRPARTSRSGLGAARHSGLQRRMPLGHWTAASCHEAKRVTTRRASAIAHSNIALVKYWGKRDDEQNLPAVPRLSLTLDALSTATTVEFDETLDEDRIELDGQPVAGRERARVVELLERVRERAGLELSCRVMSRNDFPTAAKLASSASGF